MLLVFLNNFSVIIAFLASLTIYYKGIRYPYLRFFPWFLLIINIVQQVGFYLSDHRRSNIELYNLLMPVEFCFYFYTLYMIVQNRLAKRIITAIIFVFIVVSLSNMAFIQKIHVFNSMSYALGALLVVTICIYYFFESFQLSVPVNVARLPAFWICAGLLFYYACTFPLLGLVNFLGSAPRVILNNFGTILNLLNLFLYSSFTIAFLCRIRVRSSMS